MTVQVVPTPFDPWSVMAEYQGRHADILGRFGATGVFVGTMRYRNGDAVVDSMDLEHYPGMTERALEEIISRATERWAIMDALIVHRVGTVFPGDPIVLTATWARHRGDALDACRHIMEELKSRAPFWKREIVGGEPRWVEKNTEGYLRS